MNATKRRPTSNERIASALFSQAVERVRLANHRGCTTTEIDVPNGFVGNLLANRLRKLDGHDAAVDEKRGGQLVVRIWW